MKLMVIDGNSLFNRSFYAIRPLTTADGLHTNAVYGFITTLNKLLNEDKPDALCVTFDRKEPTFRHLRYSDYKGTRKPMPSELAEQFPVLKEVLDAMNIPRFELAGWEADDLLGTLSARAAAEGWETILVTGDRDSLQLIGDKTFVRLMTSKLGKSDSTLYTAEVFEAEYGFPPIRLIDLKALMGDSSDNIPGVAGVGSKTASELLSAYGSLENIYAHLDDIKPSVQKKLVSGQESAQLSFALATIRRDAPLDFTLERLTRSAPDHDALYRLFIRLEFSRLLSVFGISAPTETAAELPKCSVAALTPAVIAEADQPLCIVYEEDALGVCIGTLCYEAQNPDPALLSSLFASPQSKIAHGLKDLFRRLDALSLPSDGFIFDTELGAYLLDPSDHSYSLQRCCAKLLGTELPEAASAADKAHSVARLYACELPKLQEQNMLSLLQTTELPLARVLADMENTGFKVDRSALLGFGQTLGSSIEILQDNISRQAGGTLNLNSPKQLGVFLFETLGLPPLGKTKSGYATNIEVLEKLRNRHPVVEDIIEYRKLTKLKSTYADALPKYMDANDRIHTRFNMTGTATGRLSSSEPNLQNIPVRTELGGEVRKMFIASEGNVLVDADYSQIELRILSHLSGDTVMQNAFLRGEDIHRATAAQVFGLAPEEVTPLLRSRAKAVNFGIVYGISDFSLAQDLHISRSEAKHYIESYLQKFSGVRDYMRESVEKARRDGFAVTLFGRKRYLPELSSSNYNTRSFGERVALNMPVQGTAADIMKLAMVKVYQRLHDELPEARLLLQVHDELIVECPEAKAEQAMRILEEEMSSAASLSVPLPAEAHFGRSWYDVK